jgi:hypothetical protein
MCDANNDWPLSPVSGSFHFAAGTKVEFTEASSSVAMPSAAAQAGPTNPPLLSPALTSAWYLVTSAALISINAALAMVPMSEVPAFPSRKVRAVGSSPK